MKFHVEHALWCPACGWFGRKARRRNRAADAAAHIRWAAQIARDIRRERAEKVFRETDSGLFAAMVEHGPDPVPWHVLVALGEGTIAVLEPEPTDAERRETWFNLPEGGPW
ncbi:hypothetical protein STINGER_91 [Mycobacterium phage Stinger]|uniref:Uncharacterized protein n=1 Tax=Mycobacterium phage Stinger TaxID=1089137 RepID=G8I9L2_9CAUD|nr:hypothetical protein STINGER_91 [Mycobacterium phage Stinger]AER49405.1 hypothetical protein STINGER_91 [Mycobacterium phage Stinger]